MFRQVVYGGEEDGYHPFASLVVLVWFFVESVGGEEGDVNHLSR